MTNALPLVVLALPVFPPSEVLLRAYPSVRLKRKSSKGRGLFRFFVGRLHWQNMFALAHPNLRTRSMINWMLVLIWMGVIWFLSSIPDLSSGLQQDFILRKIAHVLEFALLTVLLYRALPKPRHQHWQRFALAALLALAYAAIDEIHQGYVPGREPNPKDVAIDALGIGLGSAIVYVTVNKFRLRSASDQSGK